MGLMYSGKTKKQITIIALAVAVLIVAIIILLSSNKVRNVVTVEAGIEALDIFDFVKNKMIWTFVTDLSTNNLNTPGIYDVKIKIGKNLFFESRGSRYDCPYRKNSKSRNLG